MKKKGKIICTIDSKTYDHFKTYSPNLSKMEQLKTEIDQNQKEDIKNITLEIIDQKMSKITNNYNFNFKIITLGNSFVGKSTLLNRYFHNIFEKNTNPTITVDFFTKNLTINKKSILLTAYDTAGSENFMSMTKRYVQDKHLILFTYDVSNKKSLVDLKKWINFADEVKREGCISVLVGTKIDKEREIGVFEGMQFAKDNNMAYYEISSKEDENVDKLFKYCVLKCFRRFRKEENKNKVEEFRVFNKRKRDRGCFVILKRIFGIF